MFTANLPPETNTSGPSYRDWGANSWWQNTRLTYWNMAPAGDFDSFASIFEFYLQTLPFNAARTLAYFGHAGIFYTETKTLFGAFAVGDYGQNASTRTSPTGLPKYAVTSTAFGTSVLGPVLATRHPCTASLARRAEASFFF